MQARTFFGVLLAGLMGWAASSWAASEDSGDNGTQKTYYWQGNQINNMSRLGSTGFEEDSRKTQTGRNQDEYLSKIREQIAHQAGVDAKAKTTLDFGGSLLGNPVEIVHAPSGVQIILHSDMLFDENTADFKNGAADILNHLQTLLDRESQTSPRFVMADSVTDDSQARELDAQRSLAILTALEFSRLTAEAEN